MPILRVDDFKGQLSGGGARPTLFDVLINYPAFAVGDAENTSFMVRAANLPASTQGVIPVGFRGRQVKFPGDREFEPWTVTVINDTDFGVRNAMERWMNAINAHVQNTGLTSPASYEADMAVRQLDKNGDVLKRYDFRGAFPSSISEIEVDYEATNTIENFQVTFEYQYWTSNTTS